MIEVDHISHDEIKDSSLDQREIRLMMARLDRIHPVVSGNKLFKLQPFIEKCQREGLNRIVSFGGPYSNHLAATAFACKTAGIEFNAIVRGDNPRYISHTLKHCLDNDASLIFTSHDDYRNWQSDEFESVRNEKFGRHILIPEGGYHPDGAKGASLISNLLMPEDPTHVITAVGSATTLAGLLMSASCPKTAVIAVPVLRGMQDINERVLYLTGNSPGNRLTVWNDFHLGGYARSTTKLISFMNHFFQQTSIPTDFVYTGKMMLGVYEKIKAGYFPEGSVITCLHTGGLQGNLSLPSGTLLF